jgi:hypothetical protein
MRDTESPRVGEPAEWWWAHMQRSPTPSIHRCPTESRPSIQPIAVGATAASTGATHRVRLGWTRAGRAGRGCFVPPPQLACRPSPYAPRRAAAPPHNPPPSHPPPSAPPAPTGSGPLLDSEPGRRGGGEAATAAAEVRRMGPAARQVTQRHSGHAPLRVVRPPGHPASSPPHHLATSSHPPLQPAVAVAAAAEAVVVVVVAVAAAAVARWAAKAGGWCWRAGGGPGPGRGRTYPGARGPGRRVEQQ